ncbi:MAG: hypothetical protein GY950_22655 [bacterium]|nr:hypothetical protein [bacterium]
MFETKKKQFAGENKPDKWLDLLTGNSLSSESNSMSMANRVALKDIIKDISQLRDKGTLSDERFSSLMVYICSAFIENELNMRIGRVLTQKTNRIFDRLNYG